MRIQTFSIVTGSEACNARCPYCVSKMTLPQGVELKEPTVNWRNFRKACQLAKQCGVTTAMITGKGEPTLFPNQISEYLRIASEYRFPFIELQTNAIRIDEDREEFTRHFRLWYDLGLTTVAISLVDSDPEFNRVIFTPHKTHCIDLPRLIVFLHELGLSVRLACVMIRGGIDDVNSLKRLISFAKQQRVEQLTIRPVNKADFDRNHNLSVWNYVNENSISPERLKDISRFLTNNGKLLMTLAHGALVYDVGGQNVCLTDSLTIKDTTEDLRQLIFFPDGHLRYDWQHEGAILL